jgi:outer membrane protein TolC
MGWDQEIESMKGTLVVFLLGCLAPSLVASGAAASNTYEEADRAPVLALPDGYDEIFDKLPPLEPERDFHVGDPELGRLLGIVLRENPDIRAARRTWRASLERPAQTRSLPDPKVSLGYFVDNLETRVGPQEYGVALTQPVPWLSKLSTEGRRAERLAASLEQAVRQVERDRVRDFKSAYYNSSYMEEALRINAEEQRLLRRFEQIALTRYSTGEGIQQNAIKVQTEITRLIDQATFLEERRDIFVRRLAQLLGRPDAVLELRHAALSVPELDYDIEALESEALNMRPALGALREKIRADEFFVKRRRLDSRPDFSFGISYTNVDDRTDPAGKLAPPPDNGDDALALVAGITIPLYSGRISSGIREAHETLNADLQRLDQGKDQVRFDVQEAGLRLDSLLERTVLYRDNLIPQAEQSLSSTEAAYQTNQLDFLDLIDAERIWFQVRLTYRRLLSDVWIALANLERAIGSRFPAVAAGETESTQ